MAIELTIERLAHGGDAIGHLPDGKAVFVRGGCPGDRALVEIEHETPRYARGRATDILEPSLHRIEAPCPYFGVCGGCTWQHIDVELQRQAKRSAVVEALKRIGRFNDAEHLVAGCVPSPRQYGYRNKIELLSDPSAPRPVLGFSRAHAHEIVAIDSCLLLDDRASEWPRALTGAVRYLASRCPTPIERVGVRISAHTNAREVALWTAPGPFPRSLAHRVIAQAVPATSVVRVLARPGERSPRRVEVLGGAGHWRERLIGRAYTVSAPSFFQVNTGAAERLVELVLAAAAPLDIDRALDLFAGAGTFTVPLAQLTREVVAVEASGSAIADLRRNLERNGAEADVVGGDAARELPRLGRFDLIVVDPPRAGLPPSLCMHLAEAGARVLVYVSCDPATLARDAGRLREAGLRLDSVTPVDLFPQTYHVESVARFVPA